MTDGANTPLPIERDLSYLGPATLSALHVGVKACDDDIAVYETVAKSRKLTRTELDDLARARASRDTLLTQPYPPPYHEGRDRRERDSGSHPGEADPV